MVKFFYFFKKVDKNIIPEKTKKSQKIARQFISKLPLATTEKYDVH